MQAISFYSSFFRARLGVKPLACAIGLASTLGLAGCGSSGDQDNGSIPGNPSVQNTISGVAVDGHLARATVYVDVNNNSTRDSFEVFAFTDNDGYFSYNPLTGTDYCASDAIAEQSQYCLRYLGTDSSVIIRIDGGYDTLTGEPAYGQMSRRINPNSAEDRVSAVVSPLSTLVSIAESDEEKSQLLNSVGLTADDLDIDYLRTNGSDGVDNHLFNSALKIHKSVAVLSDLIDDKYAGLEDESGVPNDGSQSIYAELAASLLSSGNNLDSVLEDSELVANVLDKAERRIRQVYENRGLDLPSNIPSDLRERAAGVANRIPDVVDRLIQPLDTNKNQRDVIGSARAVEVVVIKAQGNSGSDNSAEDAIDFILDVEKSALVDALSDSLSDEKADVSGVVNANFRGDNFASEEAIKTSAKLPEDANAFADLSGFTLKISDQDLGIAPSNVKDIEVELYFSGETGSTEGELIACVKYIDGADTTTKELGEGNTRGELVEGYWSLLGASRDNPRSYNLLITVEFLGATNQAIVKPTGPITRNGKSYHGMRFDFDGDITTWLSESGLQEGEFMPQSNSDCQERLPSRVGL